MPAFKLPALIALALLPWGAMSAFGQAGYEFYREPISYQTTTANNSISDLQARIDKGDVTLDFHKTRGFLDSILKELNIEPSTQALVFSKTSFQIRPINPSNPRALYFNDDVYVGWVPTADKLEFIAADPKLGSVLYTLKQTESEKPVFARDRGACLQCHATRRTKLVPGPLVRSLYTSASGQPVYNFGNFLSDHTTPFKHRWGGYYVTGSHGSMVHMGNMFVSRDDDPDELDLTKYGNRLSLSRNVHADNYLVDTSDIVALMVLEHQSQMQNLITHAIYEEERAKHYDQTFNLTDDGGSDFTKRRLARSVENLLKYMFLVDEFPLASPVTGTSSFSKTFSRREPITKSGKSLYQLDLQTRMFRYPLSYMVYTESFAVLGPRTTALLHTRIKQVLSETVSEEDAELFAHLTPPQKQDIKEILKETHSTLGKLFE